MINRRFAMLSILAIAAVSLPGCVAVAIPALAGSAMLGSRVDGKDAGETQATVAVAKPIAAPMPVTVPVAVPVMGALTAAKAEPVIAAPVAVALPRPAPVSVPASVSMPAPVPASVPVPVPVPVILAVPKVLAPTAPTPPPPSAPIGQPGFAQFVRYGSAVAAAGTSGTAPLSAMLSDPVAIDGQRRRCEPGEQAVALIDLDPQGSVFAPPASPRTQPGLALGLAVLREAGVVITWLSDLSVNQSGALRTALEQSGLDPRGIDIISLSREADDRKQQRKDNLAGITCIIAIAGDERPDFDERFKYLRSPEAGAELEPVIGDGWFLIDPVFPPQKDQRP